MVNLSFMFYSIFDRKSDADASKLKTIFILITKTFN